MSWNPFLLRHARKSRARRPLARHFRPLIERLEDRSLLATIAVNTTLMDPADGLCSLSEAIIAANSNAALGRRRQAKCARATASGLAADTINLVAGTYTLTTVDPSRPGNDPVGLPDMASTITFQGAVLAARSSTSQRRGTPDFPIAPFRGNTSARLWSTTSTFAMAILRASVARSSSSQTIETALASQPLRVRE